MTIFFDKKNVDNPRMGGTKKGGGTARPPRSRQDTNRNRSLCRPLLGCSGNSTILYRVMQNGNLENVHVGPTGSHDLGLIQITKAPKEVHGGNGGCRNPSTSRRSPPRPNPKVRELCQKGTEFMTGLGHVEHVTPKNLGFGHSADHWKEGAARSG